MGATTAAYYAANIDALIAAEPRNHTDGLYRIGVNDFITGNETDWKADVLYVLDAMKARWPAIQIKISKTWKQGFDSTASTYAGWVDDIVAARSSFVSVGDDERTWLKGADDGATNTTDGVHYSAAGQTAAAAAIQTALGY